MCFGFAANASCTTGSRSRRLIFCVSVGSPHSGGDKSLRREFRAAIAVVSAREEAGSEWNSVRQKRPWGVVAICPPARRLPTWLLSAVRGRCLRRWRHWMGKPLLSRGASVGRPCLLDFCKRRSVLAQERPGRAQPLRLFHANCSLTWQTPPLKGVHGGTAMICARGVETDGKEIYLPGRRREALGTLSRKASICHDYHI